MPAKPKKIETLTDLSPDSANVNKGSERGKQIIGWSIAELGAGRSILVDSDGTILAGNKTWEIAVAHEMPVKVVQTEGDELVVVQRTDLRLDGDGDERVKARQLAIADNKSQKESYVEDVEILLEHARSVDVSPMYSQGEIDALLAGLSPSLPEPGAGGDEFDPDTADVETRCKTGDLWLIHGNGITHRLLCGDSTKAHDVARVMDGEKAGLLLTDPPYNVAYTGKTKDALTIENDSMSDSDFRDFLRRVFQNAFDVMRDGASFYVWHADSEGYNFRGAIFDTGQQVRQCLVWVKDVLVMGRQDYHWKHEPCLYGWKSGDSHTWLSDRKQTTVLNFERPTRNAEHPTMKPVNLFEYLIGNSANANAAVLDIFSGSGTTLIACHRTGRQARLIEIEPKYCDVILARAEAEGLTVERADG